VTRAAPIGARLTTPANLLGLLRIALTPVVIVLLVVPFPGSGLLAFVVFVVAALTDFLDGRVARARGEVSPFGVFMDLTADKVLVAGVLIAMVQVGLVPAWIVATILIREFVIQGVRQLAATDNVVIAARALGKSKTLTTLAAMAILLLAFDATHGGPAGALGSSGSLETAGFWLMIVATALTVISAIDYLAAASRILTGHGGG
jgi:CDP-diacylglycerol--glycerol-3-phosphate 3-phosphatidyltransferase